MEITVRVPEELASLAQSRGVSIEAYVQEILTREAAATSANGKLQTPEEIRVWLDSLAQFSDRIPSLPEMITRDWIYQDHDQLPIASCLVDTNILLRIARRADPQHQMIDAALAKLAADRCKLCFTHQNIAELWNVMTRPVVRNGFGLSASDADREVRVIEAGMSLLSDSDAVYRVQRRIVVHSGVFGVQVHDARLAAAMEVHGVRHILTVNTADSSRFAGITAVHPSVVPTL